MRGEVYGARKTPPHAEIVRRALPADAAGRAGPLGRAQAELCHTGLAPYRCFLPDLTRFGAPAAQDPGSSQRAVVAAGKRTAASPARFLVKCVQGRFANERTGTLPGGGG